MASKFEKLDKLLTFHRKKYTVFSYFFTPKKLVVDFIPLDKIPSEFCICKSTIKESEITQTYLPKNWNEEQEHIDTKLFPIKLYALENVYVVMDSSFFITKKLDKIFYEKVHEDNREIYLYNNSKIYFNTHKLAKIRNQPKKNSPEEVIFFGGLFTTNYYHFLLEIISKSEFLQNIPNHKSLQIILDISVKNNDNLRTIAEFFLKDYSLIYLDSNFYYHFHKIWHITSPNTTVPNIVTNENYEAGFTKISKTSLQYIRKKVLENYDGNQVKIENIKRVFIDRKTSSLRNYNREQLFPIIRKYGFVSVYFEDLNIHEQIFVLQNADYVIGPSGAAFTNLIFAKNGSKGLMWLDKVWGDFSVFSTIAEMMDFDLYTYRYSGNVEDFHADYALDAIKFEQHIVQLLNL